MVITREQVADLREGDVVEVRDEQWPGVIYRGPLHAEQDYLCLGPLFIRTKSEPSSTVRGRTLTVVSRAPRPLYVNHPRTEPVPGDVIRDEDGVVWLRDSYGKWSSADSEADEDSMWWTTGPMPTLLVDGETGQVVP